MNSIKYPKVHSALKEGRRINFEGKQFFFNPNPIRITEEAEKQSQFITWNIEFFNDPDALIATDFAYFQVRSDLTHNQIIDILIEQAIQYLSKEN